MLIFIATISDERIRNKFEQIYFEYSRYLYVIGFNILRDKESIEDAMQQCFIKIFNNIDKISIIQSKQTKSFISVIMRNEAINIYNNNKALSSKIKPLDDEDDVEDQNSNIEEILARAELKKEVYGYIKALNVNESNIIILKYVKGYSSQEISGLLGVSQEVVRQRLSRAKKKLVALIADNRRKA